MNLSKLVKALLLAMAAAVVSKKLKPKAKNRIEEMAKPDSSTPAVLKPLEPITRAYWILHPQKPSICGSSRNPSALPGAWRRDILGSKEPLALFTSPSPMNRKSKGSVIRGSGKLPSPVHGPQKGTLFPCGIEHEASVEG